MKRILVEVGIFTALIVGSRLLFAGLRWLLDPTQDWAPPA